ncbi:MAG TPA: hypothetical protein VN260_07090, partial [Dissulfurispiraceae bacterium]|nr:hypothetical protein [Dissulfurispiraceae bacterium]
NEKEARLFAGFQIDVEPYTKPDFNLRKGHYAGRYLKMVKELKAAAGDDLPLSVVLPFWFDSVMLQDKPLSFHVMDVADEVVLMSYRTTFDELVASGCDELTYAGVIGKPLLLGIETVKLPRERHIIIARREALKHLPADAGDIILTPDIRDRLPVDRQFFVRPEKITFFGKLDQVKAILAKQPPYEMFSGYVIHSFESYLQQGNGVFRTAP